MKKLVMMVFISLFLIGCSEKGESVDHQKVVIQHDLGETKVSVNPKKVVTFDLGILDMLDTLEIDVSAVPKSNLSKNLSKYKSDEYLNAGTLFEPDFEALSIHQPDLIIISGRAAKNYEELSKLAPTISLNIDNSQYMQSVINRLETIESLFPEAKNKIEREVTELSSQLSDLQGKSASLEGDVLFLLTNGDTISVYGPQSRFGMVYDDFGLSPLAHVSVDDSTHGQQVSFEFIAQHDPEYILVMDRVIATASDGIVGSDLLDNSLIKSTVAYQDDHIYYLDPFVWYLESGGLQSTKAMMKEISNLMP